MAQSQTPKMLTVLDRAQYVAAELVIDRTIMVVWYGGATFNVYREDTDGLREIDVFTCYGEGGKPLSDADAEEKARECLEIEKAEIQEAYK